MKLTPRLLAAFVQFGVAVFSALIATGTIGTTSTVGASLVAMLAAACGTTNISANPKNIDKDG